MSATYGYDVALKDDPYVDLAEESVSRLADALIPGKYAVNSVPILRHYPDWLPGSGFKRVARTVKEMNTKITNGPLEALERAMVSEDDFRQSRFLSIPQKDGEERSCLAVKLLEGCHSPEERENIKCVCATSYAGVHFDIV